MTKKLLIKGLLVLSVFISMVSCSSDDNGDTPPEDQGSNFAMTFRMNGELFEFNNPFGTNAASDTTIFSAYSPDEYILLQGRDGILGPIEVLIWIDRDDLVSGTTRQVDFDTFETATHVDLINLTDNGFESTLNGSVTILEADTVNKTVRGTFEFNAVRDAYDTNVVYAITEGTFNYTYE
ncbi:MAG: hypothetical protein AAF617_10550 [Bacteroidota bacterium]